MTLVYGNSIEPSGMSLDKSTDIVECPNCGNETAVSHFYEACEGGSINQYHSLHCPACGHSDGNDLADDEECLDYDFSEFLES